MAGRRTGLVGVGLALLLTGSARAQLPAEEIGLVERLSPPLGPHWVWASDPVMHRSALVDLESGEMLGMVNGGWGITVPLFARSRPELYVPETHYSRGSRGVRTDVVTFYDAVSLAAVGEAIIPGKRAINALTVGNAAISDDDRFIAVFNMTPATSLSIVDTEKRRFVEEIQTPGCALVYAAGPRRFAMLCGDGSALLVSLDASGRELTKQRTARFFDPEQDPVTEKAARWRDTWLFVSFEGNVHPVDISGEEPVFGEVWSLHDETDRAESWRIGGTRHLAVHQQTGRLYALMHRGGPDTHKDGGRELWIYELADRSRTQRLELRSPGITFMGNPIAFGDDWVWPLNNLDDWLVDTFAGALGVDQIAVTQDAQPLLVTAGNYSGSMAIYDALSLDLLRRVSSGNMATMGIETPWDGLEVAR